MIRQLHILADEFQESIAKCCSTTSALTCRVTRLTAMRCVSTAGCRITVSAHRASTGIDATARLTTA